MKMGHFCKSVCFVLPDRQLLHNHSPSFFAVFYFPVSLFSSHGASVLLTAIHYRSTFPFLICISGGNINQNMRQAKKCKFDRFQLLFKKQRWSCWKLCAFGRHTETLIVAKCLLTSEQSYFVLCAREGNSNAHKFYQAAVCSLSCFLFNFSIGEFMYNGKWPPLYDLCTFFKHDEMSLIEKVVRFAPKIKKSSILFVSMSLSFLFVCFLRYEREKKGYYDQMCEAKASK